VTAAKHQSKSTALDWSVAAMHDATNNVNRIRAANPAEAFAAIAEAVWWVTLVDDNIRARHGKAYHRAARATSPSPRRPCVDCAPRATEYAMKSK
jgi:hypothetical protein